MPGVDPFCVLIVVKRDKKRNTRVIDMDRVAEMVEIVIVMAIYLLVYWDDRQEKCSNCIYVCT